MIQNITIDGSQGRVGGKRKCIHWLTICDGEDCYLPASEFEIVARLAFQAPLSGGWVEHLLLRGRTTPRYIHRLRDRLRAQGIGDFIETGYMANRLAAKKVEIRRRVGEFSLEFAAMYDRLARGQTDKASLRFVNCGRDRVTSTLN